MAAKDNPEDQGGVTFRQLLLLAAVTRHGSVTRGASEFGLSQPAATQSLAALQARTGLDLVERSGRQTTATETGRVIVRRLAPLLARVEAGLAELGVDDPRWAAWNLPQAPLTLLAAIRAAGTLEKALAGNYAAGNRRAALRALAGLEAVVGSRLVDSFAGESTLTGAGMVLAERLGSVPREVALILSQQAAVAHAARTTLAIGVAPDPGTAGLDEVVLGHFASQPGSSISILEGSVEDLLARLVLGEVDLVVCHFPKERREDCDWTVLGRSTFAVAAGRHHPLAGRPRVPLAELTARDWLLGPPGSERRTASDILFTGREQPRCRLVTVAAPLMAKVLVASDCLALLTERELAARPQLAVIAHDTPKVAVTLGWVCRAGWEPGPLQRDLIERLTRHYADD
jgi:DNA-binding transcriptional LysR family regulator